MGTLVAPSMLSADFTRLADDVQMVNQSDADWFHIDVMDGVFVPNITMGFLLLEAINRVASKPLDVHLMIVHPEKYIERFRDAGAANISVHIEACTHLHRVIQQIKQTGAKAGVAVNPHTPIDHLSDIIEDLDLVCLMSVNPGFGGQKFIERTYDKVEKLKQLITERGAQTLIEIDGGVTLDNAPRLVALGADVLVAGNTVFSANNPGETIRMLKTVPSHNIPLR